MTRKSPFHNPKPNPIAFQLHVHLSNNLPPQKSGYRHNVLFEKDETDGETYWESTFYAEDHYGPSHVMYLDLNQANA